MHWRDTLLRLRFRVEPAEYKPPGAGARKSPAYSTLTKGGVLIDPEQFSVSLRRLPAKESATLSASHPLLADESQPIEGGVVEVLGQA